ncbi:hypothetical protein UFOVP545_26 [uncultured Caudovirales phage]|uniref:Uncharacterized protein n=1 Tax=uncultured Caudovirales phage TaxID=2100421 RepID=A0A6J5MRG1_9CAUD|nr:hypothetical protein UFOVP545_26 [uncultured Caudovirales phage]
MTPWGSKEIDAQKKADKVISKHKKDIYANGFLNGVRYARDQVVEFLEAHHSLGDILTIEEVIKELQYWKIQDKQLKGLADGKVASVNSMDESPDICQDCFGPDLCFMCERVVRG